MCSAPPPPISRAPPDLGAWTRCFLAAPIPVLADTAAKLQAYRANEDRVDAHLLAACIDADPLMSLKLMAHVAGVRSARSNNDPQTVTAALVLLGIAPFFRAFGTLCTVDEHLAGQPQALHGLNEAIARAHRGATFALAFAAHRRDPDAAVLHAAARWHALAELLLWLHAPALALQLAERQRSEPTRPAAQIQRELLNVELPELQQALAGAWRLPGPVAHGQGEGRADAAQLRCVQLALRLARHRRPAWDDGGDPALQAELRETASLLQLGEGAARQLLREVG